MREKLAISVQVLCVVLLLLAISAVLFIMITFLPWSLTWDLWVVLTAIGTVGATLVALTLAFRSWINDKDSTARFVSAWIIDEYQPRKDGISYKRMVRLNVANESNEPVYNAAVNVHVGHNSMPLGPLAAPSPISVVPPRRELVFDVSIPLMAHSDSWFPKAALTFTDSKGRRWYRGLNGELRNVSRQKLRWSKKPEQVDERQLGDRESLFNPMTVALMFLAGLRNEEMDPEELHVLLAAEASGWATVDFEQLRTELNDFQPTSMVDYPAARIARIKLSGDKKLEGKTVRGYGESLELEKYAFMTLTLNPSNGWRVFGIGENVPPAAIYFGGSLSEEVNPYQDGVTARGQNR